jgi:hypothetical protein
VYGAARHHQSDDYLGNYCTRSRPRLFRANAGAIMAERQPGEVFGGWQLLITSYDMSK